MAMIGTGHAVVIQLSCVAYFTPSKNARHAV
jgi:hypothetical protein